MLGATGIVADLALTATTRTAYWYLSGLNRFRFGQKTQSVINKLFKRTEVRKLYADELLFESKFDKLDLATPKQNLSQHQTR